jgi:hypothetical protein
METNKNQNNLDEALRAMKETSPTDEQVRNATGRVLSSLKSEPGAIIPERLRNDADFSTLLQPYLRGELTEAQKMLVEDRIATNPAYRRQLETLRGNVREMAPPRRARSTTSTVLPWAIAAGLLITTGYFMMDTLDRMMAPGGARAEIASVSGDIYKVSAAGLVPVKPGAPLTEGEAIRTAKGSSAVVRLPDGSLIEMNERAELSISAAYSGSTIRLERGNILVQAAKQKRGTLKVATRESTVSVKGTIFSVAAGLRGTQVAVVEGHVVVDQGGKSEDLLPGQSTGSQTSLKRTTVPEQIAWSKDSAKYMSMLGELSKIARQIEALPMPSLRTQSTLMSRLPADTVVYAAIPNISGTVADATRIFEDRLKQSPALQAWWNTQEVAQIRELAENLRTAGSHIGDEIVIAASKNANGGPGEPVLMAEVKGAGGRTALESQIRQFAGEAKLEGHLAISDSLLTVGRVVEGGGFDGTSLAATVKKSYAKGAGWILAADLEQILPASVKKNEQVANLTGMNQLRHLVVERRDIAGRSNMSASVSFTAPRTGIASWLAAPAPMPSLDYISPDAYVAMSAVTKDASQMANEFFSAMGNMSTQIDAIEKQLGINVVTDLIGTLGGEVTMAVDGTLLPVPTYVLATEVYNSSLLTGTLRRVADAFNQKTAGTKLGTVTFAEQVDNGRTWYSLKHSAAPVEIHFTYSDGFMIAAQSRDTILKALQNRASMLSLPRSQRFIDLLPADAQVNASAVFYANLGSSLQSAASAVKGTMKMPESQKQAIEDFAASTGPVLITAYAGEDSITFASSSGFFGFGLDSLLAAGKGAPILPQILSSAMGGARNSNKQKVQ